MTLNELIAQLKSDLKSIENIYRGLVITELSLPSFNRNSKGIYNNTIYVDAINKTQSVKLLINLSILNEAIKNGHTINENVSVDVTIDSITLDSKGIILIKISKIVESGISEQELFIKNLTTYCKDNRLFERKKKCYPTLIKKVALISTTSSNTLDDIIKNINHNLQIISIKVMNTSNAIAEQIGICNNEDFDLILLYRGGHEDKSMNIYSDIPVLNSIHNSNIHVGVALGHEVDTPFVYKIADSTYSTPTNFAQVVNNYNQSKIDSFQNTINGITNSIRIIKDKIQSSFDSLKWDNINTVIDRLDSQLKLSRGCIEHSISKTIHTFELENENLNSSINKKSLIVLNSIEFKCNNQITSISKIADNLIHKNEVNLHNLNLNIESVNQQLISNMNNNLLTCASNINSLTNEIKFKIEQKRNKKVRLILVTSLIITLAVIVYFILNK